MKMRKIGTTDIDVSAVSLGAWAIGGGPWWGASDTAQSIEAIHAALDAGINMIDTAPAYGLGRSEEVIAKAIAGRRDKVIIATKCGIWWQDKRDVVAFEVEGQTAYKSLDPQTIQQEVEMSLKRLNTDYIDLYQTHWPSTKAGVYQIEDTMGCLLKLKEQGKIRAIGASNVSIEEIQAYQAVAVLDTIQPRYSMLDRTIEEELLPFCIDNNISTLAYSPLEQGLLTGKFTMDYVIDKDNTRNGRPWFRPENRQRVLNLLSQWHDLTEKYDCTIGQLVIAWTVAQAGISFVLCGARHAEHAIANARAGDITLSDIDIRRIREDVLSLGAPKI